MRSFRVGIVGAGVISRTIHLPVLLSMNNVQIAWITDANENSARSLSRAFRLPQVPLPPSLEDLPDCDVALLAIPVGFRMAYYEAFARRGIAVFAEKPFTVTSKEHQRILALYPPERIGCGYMRRNYATAQLLRRAVAEAWFGRLERIGIREGARSTKSGADVSHYDDVKASGGGVLIALGCHALDQAFHITGAGAFQLNKKNLELDGAIDRKVEASVRLLQVRGKAEEQCDFDFCISWLDRQDNRIELTFPEVILSTGIGPNSPVLLHPRSNGGGRGQEFVLAEGAKTSNQAFFLEWDLFLRGLEEGKPSAMAASTAFLTSALIDTLYERGDAA